MTHKLCRPFGSELNPELTVFLALYVHLDIDYMYYLKKLCMFPVSVDFCKAMQFECLNLACACHVRGPQIVQTFL